MVNSHDNITDLGIVSKTMAAVVVVVSRGNNLWCWRWSDMNLDFVVRKDYLPASGSLKWLNSAAKEPLFPFPWWQPIHKR